MKKVETAGKTAIELQVEVATLRAKLRELAFKAAGAQGGKPHEHRTLRRNIARLLTALRAKEGAVDNT